MKNKIITLLILICLTFCGCEDAEVSSGENISVSDSSDEIFDNRDVNSNSGDETSEIDGGIFDRIEETEINVYEKSADNNVTQGEIQYTIETLDIPDYSGDAVAIINGNIPYFTDEQKQRTDAFEEYSSLDALGRCGVAFANICPEIEPTEERGPIGMVRPSGWHTIKYNDLIDGNYLYNRCHLIGYQLAGENANTMNLITGTRYLNVVGMLPYEDEVDDYVDSTGNHVLYRVTPVFDGDNPVADGVLMEAYSVEDVGEGVCFNVFCYNVQPGIIIDYTTGDSRIDEAKAEAILAERQAQSTSSGSSKKKNKVQAPNMDIDGEDLVWVPNRGGTKYHKNESCGNMVSPSHIPQKEAIDRGYEPCKRCY